MALHIATSFALDDVKHAFHNTNLFVFLQNNYRFLVLLRMFPLSSNTPHNIPYVAHVAPIDVKLLLYT